MLALTVRPGDAGRVQVTEVPEPSAGDGEVLVATLGVGVCGTDLEIAAGEYGQAPPGEERLVLGHESIGRVVQPPGDSRLAAGDLVVGMVRHPDPVPCRPCSVGEWDMCRNGRYTEHGIKGLHGFARERYRAPADRLVRVAPDLGLTGVLLEPTSVVAKAWEHIDHISGRARYRPEVVLVTGAGPIGLLAALLAVQRGFDTHVLDLVTDGPKPDLVRRLGATYHAEPLPGLGLSPDVLVECTGVAQVVADAMAHTAKDGITCLTGVSAVGRTLTLDVGRLNRELVLENDVVFGSVNANRRHYEAAAVALAGADRTWLDALITRRVPLAEHAAALSRSDGDVKVVLELNGANG